MRFTSLAVENFKQFEHVEVAFAPGFTVVRGPNEAGKSSIQAALLAALFLDPRTPLAQLGDYIRWGQAEAFSLTLTFEDAGTDYTLVKDLRAQEVSLSWHQGASGVGVSRDPAAVAAILASLLGAGSLDTYANTACIRSEEVSTLPSAAAPVSQRLLAKVTGGRQTSAAEVIRAIEEELLAMASGGPRRLHETGVLRAARERIDALHQARSALAAKLAAHQEHTRLLNRLREELQSLERGTGELAERLEWSDRAQGLEEDCATLQEHRHELQRAETLRESVGRAAEELSGLDYETLAGALQRAQGLERGLQHQQLREAEINRQMAVLMLKQLQQGPSASATTLLIGGVALAVASPIGAAASHLLPLAVGAIPGLALIAYSVRGRRLPKTDDMQGFTDELAGCTEQIRAGQVELQQLLTTYSLRSVEELATIMRDMRPAGEVRATRQQRIARLLGERRSESHHSAVARIDHELRVRQADLAALADHRLSVEEYERIDLEVQRQRTRREQLLRELYRLEGELRANDVDSETLASMDEELVAEQVRLARLERRRKALERSHSAMKEALAATLAQASSVFRTGVTKHLGPITGGRYDQVEARIEEEGLHLLVYTADRRRAVKADSLSRATQDQIYLAARMALLELVCDGRMPPLLLDDPFVNYDDGRVESTLAMFRSLYDTHQIVLFTCTDRYDRYADAVVALDGPHLESLALAEAQTAAS